MTMISAVARSGYAPAAETNPLLSGPILPTLIGLSVPNMLAMVASALVAVAETAYVGQLGTPSLAGLALVFPFVMLMVMMSAGAMGGGVAAAISRAFGAGDEARASTLAMHALVIGNLAGVFTMALLLVFGRAIFSALGGRADALVQALAYSNVIAFAAVGIWLTNTLASVVRGGGNMRVPALTLLAAAATQVVLGGGMGLGIGPFPRLGMAGIALGQVITASGGALYLLWYLASGRARVRLDFGAIALDRRMFGDILKVGALSCISPLQTVATVLILTRLVAGFGTQALAGYGIGARLEFLLIPIAFGVGVACVPMVGMAVGAGDVARARKVAWTGGALAGSIVGAIGISVALVPDAWARIFTADAAVLAATRTYFAWAGPCYSLFGFGLCLFFASQGAGKVLGPVLAGTLRLVVVAAGGWWLATSQAPVWQMFALVGLGMAAYGLGTALVVYGTRWGVK